MNPIRKKIKHLIPSYQFGGDTNFFDYFKSIVPKIKSYQGQTNGESNLYSDDSQKYYANLLRVNNLAANNLLDIPNSTAKYTDRGTQREQVNGVSQNILDDPNSTSIRDILDANYGEPNTVYGNGRNDPSKPGEYYEKYQPKKNAALTGFYSDLDKQRTNQMLETGANIFSLMKGQETYDNKPKESFDTTNTGSFGYRFKFGGGNGGDPYDQILKNIQLDNVIKNLPITRKVSATNPSKKLYDNAGDQLISDINYVFKDKKARAKADPILKYIAESGVSKKLEKLDNKDISYIKDTVNKTGFFSLGNIGKYKDLYKYIKTETGLTSEDAKGILNKAVENESWLKRNSIKAAINPFLQFGGQLDQQSNTVFNSLKSKGYLENFDTDSFNRLSKEEQDILFKKAALDFNSKQKIPQGEIIQEIRTPLIAQIDSSNISANQDNFEQQFAKARKEGLVEFEYNGKKIAVKLNPNSKKSIVLSEKPNYKVDNSSIIGYAKDILANKQYGGSFVNKTGYTPGTESYNNPFNIIPGNDITMSQTPFPVLAKPNVGKPVVMIPGRDYKFPGASSVTEIPYKRFGGRPLHAQTGANVPFVDPGYQGTDAHIAQPRNVNNDPNYMGENDLYTYFKKGDKNFVRKHKRTNQEDVFDQQGIERAFQEDNLWTNPATTPGVTPTQQTSTALPNMIGGRMALGQTDYPAPQFGIPGFAEATSPRLPYSPGMNPANTTAPRFNLDPYANGAIYQQGVPLGQENNPYGFDGVSAPVPNGVISTVNKTNILTKDGDPWEYIKDGDSWKTRRKGSKNWITAKGGALDAIENMWGSGEFKPKNTNTIVPKNNIKQNALLNSGILRNPNYNLQVTSSNNENVFVDDSYNSNVPTPTINQGNQVYNDYYNNPNNKYYGPQFGPPVGTLPKEQRDGVYMGQLSAVMTGLPIGKVIQGIGGKAVITNLPKVGKVIEYGGKYIDDAGNFISKYGAKLGKAPKNILDKIMGQVNKNLPNMRTYPPSWNDIISQGLGTPRYANPANLASGVRTAWGPVPKQYGGYINPFH